jgi:hypothetical protein
MQAFLPCAAAWLTIASLVRGREEMDQCRESEELGEYRG